MHKNTKNALNKQLHGVYLYKTDALNRKITINELKIIIPKLNQKIVFDKYYQF